MQVKRPLANILQAFLLNTSANESLSIYGEILEIFQGPSKDDFVFRGRGECADQNLFPGVEVEGLTILHADARGKFW